MTNSNVIFFTEFPTSGLGLPNIYQNLMWISICGDFKRRYGGRECYSSMKQGYNSFYLKLPTLYHLIKLSPIVKTFFSSSINFLKIPFWESSFFLSFSFFISFSDSSKFLHIDNEDCQV